MDVNFIQIKMSAFGDYIFLIIIVIASIVQAIVQKNKKEEAEKAERRKSVEKELEDNEEPEEYSSGEGTGGSIFENMEKMVIPELLNEEKQPQVKEIVDSKNWENIEESINQKYKMFKGENKEIPKIQPETKSPQPKGKINLKIFGNFNLKKAVIYSEVLNRKYF